MQSNDLIKRMENYERIIREIVGAFKVLDFHIIVESTIHTKVFPIDKQNEMDILLLEDIHTIANDFATFYHSTPITFGLYKSLFKRSKARSFRNNEVGIFADKTIATYFKKNEDKLKVVTSFNSLPLKGYPDEEVIDKHGRTTYIEVKTTTRRDVGSPRDFYFSPLTNSKKKIRNDARHLLLCFDTFEQNEKEFIVTGWCLVDLSNIKVSMKPEFNTDNLELYREENILIDVSLNS